MAINARVLTNLMPEGSGRIMDDMEIMFIDGFEEGKHFVHCSKNQREFMRDEEIST